MIKILHTGDIHLGDLAGPTKDGANLRRQDTLRCMDAIVNKARTEGPTVTIIAGDLFNRSRVWADTALDDANDAISRFIVPLCEYSDAVVLLFGTMNHDNPRAFEVIRKATPDLKNLHIYLMNLKTTTGAYIYRDEMNSGKLAGFPYRVSNQITTDSTGLTELAFGNWADLLVGEQMGLETYTTLDGSWVDEEGTQHNAFEENLAATRALMYVDIAARHKESFLHVKNIKAF